MLNINSNPKMLYEEQRPFNGIHVLCLHRLDKADTTGVWPCVVSCNSELYAYLEKGSIDGFVY